MLSGRLAAGVAGARRDHGGGEQEGRAGQQCALEACGECGVAGGVRGEKRAGARGGDGGEDRQPDSTHFRACTEKPRSRRTDGKATFMTEESATSRNCTAHSSSLPRRVPRNKAGGAVTESASRTGRISTVLRLTENGRFSTDSG